MKSKISQSKLIDMKQLKKVCAGSGSGDGLQPLNSGGSGGQPR